MSHGSKHQDGRDKCDFQDKPRNREKYLKTVIKQLKKERGKEKGERGKGRAGAERRGESY